MPKLTNIFVSGKMSSDLSYSLLDDKNIVYSENLRTSGNRNHGALTNIKGDMLVADHSEKGTMVCIGMYEGSNNKLYYFLARKDGLSKIVEYDSYTKASNVIISDSKVLRFDMIRWKNGVEIVKPKKYLLSINQIGDLLIFSNEVWEHPRCINISRLSDYANGFTEDDILLSKKPPILAPKLTYLKSTSPQNKEAKDKFVSFAYRYKYKDGDYSTFSFFTEASFESALDYKFTTKRFNAGMNNVYNQIKVEVLSGDKNVTHVELVAVEHNTNTYYSIEVVNKKATNVANDTPISIDYFFSNNYRVLPEHVYKATYSNVPKFPKCQELAGNRLMFANYKEGKDLIDKDGNKIAIDYDLDFISRPKALRASGGNRTAISMFDYKVGMVYFDDYNNSTTVLLNNDYLKDNELKIPFEKRKEVNRLRAKIKHKAPSWATKCKFVVQSEDLTYENLMITMAKKSGKWVYLRLQGDNIDRLRKGDSFKIVGDNSDGKDYLVDDVKELRNATHGVPEDGIYAMVEGGVKFPYSGNVIKHFVEGNSAGISDVKTIADGGHPVRYIETNPNNNEANFRQRLVSEGVPFSRAANSSVLRIAFARTTAAKISLFISQLPPTPFLHTGPVLVGTKVKIDLNYIFARVDSETFSKDTEYKPVISISNTIEASISYQSFSEFLANEWSDERISHYFDYSLGYPVLMFDTTLSFSEWVKDARNDVYTWKTEDSSDDWNFSVAAHGTINITEANNTYHLRTKNKEKADRPFYESGLVIPIKDGEHDFTGLNASNGFVDIDFHNGYCFGNGVESYKINDGFNQRELKYNFRPNAVDVNGYRQIWRKTDITASGVFNQELNVNFLSLFNPSDANWKTLPMNYGELMRIISTDSDITCFAKNKVFKVLYGKSIVADLQGNENFALSKEVFGGVQTMPYEYGISDNPESVVYQSNFIYWADKLRRRFLGLGRFTRFQDEIKELNNKESGWFKFGIERMDNHHNFIGAFDDGNGEMLFSCDGRYSFTYVNELQGIQTILTYPQDFSLGMDGQMFSTYNGRLFKKNATDKMNYYNNSVFADSKVRFVCTTDPTADKLFQAVSVGSNEAWDVKCTTNFTESFIPKENLTQRESFYVSDIYRATNSEYNNATGIGNVSNIVGNSVYFDVEINPYISIGDVLVSEVNGVKYASVIKDIAFGFKSLVLENAVGFAVGAFAFSAKTEGALVTPDGSPMRGLWLEYELTNKSNEPVQLLSVSTEVTKSP